MFERKNKSMTLKQNHAKMIWFTFFLSNTNYVIEKPGQGALVSTGKAAS